MQIANPPYQLLHRRTSFIWDDFNDYTSGNKWTSATVGAGAALAISATLIGGQIVLTTGAVQANQAGFYTTVQGYKVLASKPMFFESVMQYVDALTHNAGLFLGFSDGLINTGATSPLITNGTLPKASQTAIGFYKLSGAANWSVYSQATSTIISNTTSIAADDAASSALHAFRVEVQPIGAGFAECIFFYDDAQCVDKTTLLPIKHTYTFNTTAMYAGATCVAGTANSQTPSVDYCCVGILARHALA